MIIYYRKISLYYLRRIRNKIIIIMIYGLWFIMQKESYIYRFIFKNYIKKNKLVEDLISIYILFINFLEKNLFVDVDILYFMIYFVYN